MPRKLHSEKTRNKLQKRREELQRKIELETVRKQNPEEYERILKQLNCRTREERETQIKTLKQKLNEIGIPDFQLVEFLNMGETFIETGNSIRKEIYFDGMLNGAYIIVELNSDRDKVCSIVTKNIRN